ncbi:unnamed protein product [Dovyalis caffra]|uniref:Uncharacterized protein n=1 Tax=Dovyalis caffra TaxID=77055 RepID=A0AAV1R249_9ROSI|nr:unnamed protein product [Dovyalis caffra]
MKLSCSIDSRGNCIHNESPVKRGSITVNGDHSMTELNSKPQSLSPMPYQASLNDLSTREDMFFDSYPWLESDCEDYLSVDGDFTPSCGTTPIHQGSYIETPPCEESLYIIGSARSIPEPSPADMKKQLIELFRENISNDLADENPSFQDTVNGKPIAVYLPPKRTSRSPYRSVESSVCSSETTPHRGSKPRKEKPTHYAHCCLPNIVRSLSFSEGKRGLTPAYSGGQITFTFVFLIFTPALPLLVVSHMVGIEDKLLNDKFKLFKKVKLGGIGPERRLDERTRVSNYFKLPIISGITPVSWFQDKFRASKVEIFVISSGVTPNRLLYDRPMIFTSEIMLAYSTSLPFTINSACLECDIRRVDGRNLKRKIGNFKAVRMLNCQDIWEWNLINYYVQGPKCVDWRGKDSSHLAKLGVAALSGRNSNQPMLKVYNLLRREEFHLIGPTLRPLIAMESRLKGGIQSFLTLKTKGLDPDDKERSDRSVR